MNEKLKDIQEENNIIFIYFIILTIYLYANSIEKKFLETQNNNYKYTYRNLLFVVFGISFLITLYYSIESIKELKKESQNIEIYQLKELSTMANILVLIATIIYLYIIYKDENINLEISP